MVRKSVQLYIGKPYEGKPHDGYEGELKLKEIAKAIPSKSVLFSCFGLKILGCIFTRDGRIILAIRLKSVTKIKIFVTGGLKGERCWVHTSLDSKACRSRFT